MYPDNKILRGGNFPHVFTSYFCRWQITTTKLTSKQLHANTNPATGPINTSVLSRMNLRIGDELRLNYSNTSVRCLLLYLLNLSTPFSCNFMPEWIFISFSFFKKLSYLSKIPLLWFESKNPHQVCVPPHLPLIFNINLWCLLCHQHCRHCFCHLFVHVWPQSNMEFRFLKMKNIS